VDWVAVAHPQTIGQVERANDMILQGLKPRIFDRLNKSGRKWIQELPAVVWSLRTTPSRATGFTPFFCLWGGGRPPHRPGIQVAQSPGLCRGHQPANPRGLAGPTG
jgi:hypothetical protein